MATKSNSMFKINQLAKDLGVKPKELGNTLESIGIAAKSGTAVLEADEINLLFAGLTKKRLRRGDWRFLTEKEVNMLRMGSYE